MRIIAINTLPWGSTGHITMKILETANVQLKAKTLATFGMWKGYTKDYINSDNSKCEGFGFIYENLLSALFSKITGFHNVGSIIGTLVLIRKIKAFDPDIIHLHNLHLWVINLPIIFSFLKKRNIPVVWTLHDCWAFTGQCPHFTMINCDKWKTGCHHCPQYREYPGSYVDRTETMYNLKKRWFNGIHNLTIVTPSQWLASHVKESYLKDYPVKVIHNGIDLSIFKPTKSEFRKNYNIENKFIVLGVAFDWGKRKGRDVFIDLAKKLDDRYKIVLVGTDDKVDRQLPGNIISIHRTNNQHELVKIYSAADVFVNPTLEDNFPTTNIESIACGTPVITFNTGGSPEILDDTCGSVVQCNVNEALIKEIIRTCTNKPYSQEACLTRARQYDVYENFLEYIELYKTLMEENNETIFEKNDFKE